MNLVKNVIYDEKLENGCFQIQTINFQNTLGPSSPSRVQEVVVPFSLSRNMVTLSMKVVT